MAKRILLPLDQSQTAESIVPVIADLARASGGLVRLVHVVPGPGMPMTKGPVVVAAPEELTQLENEAGTYLRRMEEEFAGLAVESVVRVGDPVQEILREAEAFEADLVAVTTSGPSGHGRRAFGSVAEEIFRKTAAAVLLFHPAQWG
jgi:nucleotide-binding universal stress UspA family protein